MDASKSFLLFIFKGKRAFLGHLSLLRQVLVRRIFIFDIYSHSKFMFGAKTERKKTAPASLPLWILLF